MKKCRVCNSPIKPFMTFSQMPLANAFIAPEQIEDEYKFEMEVASCSNCNMFQIIEQPEPEKMFHDQYVFFTRTSRDMVRHFAEYAAWVKDLYLKSDKSFVVEIGCNDGAFLENFANWGLKHIGIEPSANVAAVANQHGVRTHVDFFGKKSASEVRKSHGPADAITAANVMCHIANINDVVEGVDILLSEDGVVIFEDPYLGDIIEKTSYDQIYADHIYIFSATSIQNLFSPHGFELINLLPQETHGGSMRYVLARKGKRKVEPIVQDILQKEINQGLLEASAYLKFKENCEKNRDDLVALIRDLRSKNKRVVGYAATAKSATVLNYCGLGPNDIEFISDTTPLKQNKLSPGSHIPVLSHDEFKKDYPDYAVLFAWNHEKEIIEKEKEYANQGGKWIYFVPDVHIK